jgi:hypothetical protein
MTFKVPVPGKSTSANQPKATPKATSTPKPATPKPSHRPTSIPTRLPTPKLKCDVVISGAKVAQQNKMGTFRLEPDRKSSGKPVYRNGKYYLYYMEKNKGHDVNAWDIGPKVGIHSAWIYSVSKAATPDQIAAGSKWRVAHHGYHDDYSIRTKCV